MKTRHLSIIVISIISGIIIIASATLAFAEIGMSYTLGLDSPLKQFKSGIKAQDVKCQPNYFTLVIKSKDGTPACLKPKSIEKLIERGWASLPKAIIANNVEISIPYLIDGGNITSLAVYGEPPNKDFRPGPGIIGPDQTNGYFDFIFSLQTTKDGKLFVTIPKEITGSIAGEETVLVDGEEVDYHQIISPNTRTLVIDFTNGTGEIYILGSGYYKDLPHFITAQN